MPCFPIEEYEELLEDIHDLAIIAERRDEQTIQFEELKKRLKAEQGNFKQFSFKAIQ